MPSKTHGMSKTKIYRIWIGMKSRCSNPKFKFYRYYGGKGIKVCKRWLNFSNFFSDIGKFQPTEKHTLERINTNGDYEPRNVVWKTRKQQTRNRKSNHIIKFEGQTKILADWAETFNMKPVTLRTRLRNGWSVRNALTIPVLKRSP
jgi:hypothetical protein